MLVLYEKCRHSITYFCVSKCKLYGVTLYFAYTEGCLEKGYLKLIILSFYMLCNVMYILNCLMQNILPNIFGLLWYNLKINDIEKYATIWKQKSATPWYYNYLN